MNQNQREKRRKDRSCSMLKQMRTAKLSQIGFGYFSCNLWHDRKEKYPLFTKNTSGWKPVVSHVWELDWARVLWLLKEPFLWAYIMIKPSSLKRAFNWFNIAFLEQVNVTQQGISILPQSCLQCPRWLLTSTEIDPPRARKYHAILEY